MKKQTNLLSFIFLFFLLIASPPTHATDEYVLGNNYIAGDQVHLDGILYECMDGPYAIYCRYPTYSPDSYYGHYMWEDLGVYVADGLEGETIICEDIQPEEVLPKFATDTFIQGDRIHHKQTIYECTDPYGIAPLSYCHYAAYAPGTNYAHYFWTAKGDYIVEQSCHNDQGHACTEEVNQNQEQYPAFTAGVHKLGDIVSHDGDNYKCIDNYGYTPSFCTYVQYGPGTFYASYFWKQMPKPAKTYVCKPAIYEQDFSSLTINDIANNNLIYSEGSALIEDLLGEDDNYAIDIRNEDALFDTGLNIANTQRSFAFEMRVKPNLRPTGNQVPRIVAIGDFFHLRLDNRYGGNEAKVLLTYKAKNYMGTTMSYSFITDTYVHNDTVSKLKVTFTEDVSNGPSYAKAEICLHKEEVLESCHYVGGTLDYETLDDQNITLAPKGPGIQSTNWKYFGALDDFRYSENITDLEN